MSKQIDLGPVAIVPKGSWDANTTYEKLNLVYYSDATYLCKVNSSTGVVPSPTSSDWMQVVKSMSAVSSVNGLTGNVVVDSVDTPDNNDISTKIANTEWVTNKTNTVLTNAKSYTDTSIATTSEAIRKTVAADTKTSIEVAIDSHMQASRNEFAAKTAIADMATNTAVSTTYATKSELSTEIQTLTAATSNTYATKQSVTDLTTDVSSTYLSKVDAASTYITPSVVDTKINTAINALDTELTADVNLLQNTKISKSGDRGVLAGFETAEIITEENSIITINTESADSTIITGENNTVEIAAGNTNTTWVKTVAFSADNVMISLGENWSWANYYVPEFYRNSVLVLAWFGSFGIATLIKGDE